MRKATLFLFLTIQSFYFTFSQQQKPPVNSGEMISKGVKLHDEQKYKEAIQTYRTISRSDTNYVLSLYEIALSMQADSNYTEAIKIIGEALSLPAEKEQEPNLLTLFGSILDDMGQSQKAMVVYDSLIQKYPASVMGYLNKGITLLKLEKYSEAEQLFQQTILINPYHSTAHYRLGQTAYLQGKMVPALFGFTGYLMINPEGSLYSNAISIINSISTKPDEMKAETVSNTKNIADEIRNLEELLFSKIALDKQFKPMIKLDDPISRQLQVLFEKAEYNQNTKDFYVQFYIPLFRDIFTSGSFEPFVNHVFSGVDIKQIKDYNKKNKKETKAVIDQLVKYLSEVRATREIVFTSRADSPLRFLFTDGKLSGRGKTSADGKLTGKWEYYYSHGNIRSYGSYSANGAREGVWKYYHFNGKLRAIEQYVNGKAEGRCVYYFENGNISEDNSYKEDLLHGIHIFNYYTGGIKTRTEYKNGKLNGEKRYYYPSGIIQFIENYKEDSLHGIYKSFHESGQQDLEINYTNGLAQGVIKSHYKSGALAYEGIYSNGKMEGVFTRYYENGKIKSREQYVNGLLEGEYLAYYENGQLSTRLITRKGKTIGDALYYDDDGKQHFTFSYDNDKLKEAHFYDKSGKQISESIARSGRIELTTFNPDGVKRRTAILQTTGEIEGKESFYYRNGNLDETNEYQSGSLHGKSTVYFLNEKKKLQLEYKNGDRDGYYNSWFQHGGLESNGWYTEGSMTGDWLEYNEHGAKASEEYYLNNLLHGVKTLYWPNKQISFETNYHYGWITGYKQFDSTGKVYNQGDLHNGNGKYILKHRNGKISSQGTYVSGNLQGIYSIYYFDGTPETVQFYKNGMLDSTYKSYHYNGKLYSEGAFKMDDRIGTWKYYNSNGVPFLTEKYVNGKLHGTKINSYENGKPEREMEYVNGERQGITSRYDEEGNLLFHIIYKDDLPVAYTYLDKNGKLLPLIPLPGGSGKLETYFQNGKPSAKFEYIEGKLNGDHIMYFSNGQLWVKSKTYYNSTEGEYKEYYRNGKLKNEYIYVHDNVHGSYSKYNEKGLKLESGNQYGGSLHGPVKYYDEQGKLTKIHEYFFGHLISVENAK